MSIFASDRLRHTYNRSLIVPCENNSGTIVTLENTIYQLTS